MNFAESNSRQTLRGHFLKWNRRAIARIIGLGILLWGGSVQAADVYWNLTDFVSSAQATRRVYITPLNAPIVIGTNIITGDRRTFTNDSSGMLVVSNLVTPASYKIEFVGQYTATTFTNTFSVETNGWLNAKDFLSASLAVGSTVAYSQTASDARFVAKSGGSATNLALSGGSASNFALSGTLTVGGSATITTNFSVLVPGGGTNTLVYTNGVLIGVQ